MPSRKNIRPDPPFKDIYTFVDTNANNKAPVGFTPHQTQDNSDAFRQQQAEIAAMRRTRRATYNVSLLDDKKLIPTSQSASSVRQDTMRFVTNRPSSTNSYKTEANGGSSRHLNAQSKIKTLQKELDEVQFFREIEETGMKAKNANKANSTNKANHARRKSRESNKSDNTDELESVLKDRFYEYELLIKTLDLKLKSADEANTKLTKKVKTYKESHDQKEALEEKVKSLEKQARSTKKSNTSLEQKVRSLEETIESQKQQIKQQSKLDEKMKEKEKEIEKLEKDLHKQKKNNKTLDKQINDCIETIEEAEEQLTSCRDKNFELKNANENLEKKLSSQLSDLKQQEQSYEEKNEKLVSLQKTLNEMNDEMSTLKKQLENKGKECTTKDENLNDLIQQAKATEEESQLMKDTLKKAKTKIETLTSLLEENKSHLSSSQREFVEMKKVLEIRGKELDTKNKLLNEQSSMIQSLEERYNATNEIMESNKIMLDMQTKEVESLRISVTEQETKSDIESQQNTLLKTQIMEISLQAEALQQTFDEKQQTFDAEKSADQAKIQELSEKLALLEDNLDKSSKSREEMLSFTRSKWKKTEAELRQSLTMKQNEISQLKKKLLKEETEKDSNQKKYEKQLSEIQKKLDEATQKLIDTMSSSLANGKELEEYRSKILDSEAQNDQKIKSLQKSLNESNEKLAKSQETIEQYNQVAEKLCIEIEETKYHHDLELEEIEEEMRKMKMDLDEEHKRHLEESHTEIAQLKKKHSLTIQELRSSIDTLKNSMDRERAHNEEMNRGNESLELIFHSFQTKFSKILSTYQNDVLKSQDDDRHATITDRMNVLSDALFDTIHLMEKDLHRFEEKIKTKDQETSQLKQSHKHEMTTLQEKIRKSEEELLVARRVSTSSIEINENEWKLTLNEEREKLNRAKAEIATITAISKRNKEKYNTMKARSDAHIQALHTALEDAKADIAHLETVVQFTMHHREKSTSSSTSTSTNDLDNVVRQLQSENSSLVAEKTSLRTMIDKYMSGSNREALISPSSTISTVKEYPHDDSKHHEANNFSLDNLGASDISFPNDEWMELNDDVGNGHNADLNALREFISMRSQRHNEI